MRATRHGHGVIFLQQTQSFWLVSLHLNSGHEDGKETTQHHFHVFFFSRMAQDEDMERNSGVQN
jgi:hypothetical protein